LNSTKNTYNTEYNVEQDTNACSTYRRPNISLIRIRSSATAEIARDADVGTHRLSL